MTRRQAAIHLAHTLRIGLIRATELIALAERESAGTHAWRTEQ